MTDAAARRTPHEGEAQSVLHTCWPANRDEWGPYFDAARIEFAQFLKACGAPLTVYVANAEVEADAHAALGGQAAYVRAPYGDVWARDTGPVFVKTPKGLSAVRFGWNGWGGKYVFPGDETIGAVIAREAGASILTSDLIGEGGGLEFDGAGTLITTRQCVLNPNRNTRLTEAAFEREAERLFGVTKVIWLDEGLIGDHTDGHVDNIARFARPGVVVCQAPSGADDPNADILNAVAETLKGQTDARGQALRVVQITSPGRVESSDGELLAASHMNWIIGPNRLVMPGFNARAERAAQTLQSVFPDLEVCVSPANAIVTGGGAFHCVTCNQPA